MDTSDTTQNTRIILVSRPVREPTHENFRIETVPIPDLAEGDVLLRTIYLSLDPYMRGRMSAAKSYVAPAELGHVMVGATISQVVASRDPAHTVGEIVRSWNGWQTFAVVPGRHVRDKLDPEDHPISTSLGVLGMPGFTGYAGLLAIGSPKAGETVAVAAASGPVGMTVGQLAKIRGCHTIGIAGGPEKVAYLREVGFEQAIDHRSPTFAAELAAAAPHGIDVYFENVGGKVWEAVLPLLNTYARVPVCGLAATYNEDLDAKPEADNAPKLMRAILNRSLTVRGFIQNEFRKDYWEPFQRDVSSWIADGSLTYREDVVVGLRNAPDAFFGLLKGENFGKLLVQVSNDPTCQGRNSL